MIKWEDLKNKKFLKKLKYKIKDFSLKMPFLELKYFLFDKYNVVKISTLNRHWHDRNEILEHTIFQILRDFINKELKIGHIELGDEETELMNILDWWDWYRNYIDTVNYDEEQELKKVLEGKLKRIVELRGYMWT